LVIISSILLKLFHLFFTLLSAYHFNTANEHETGSALCLFRNLQWGNQDKIDKQFVYKDKAARKQTLAALVLQ